MEKKYPEEFKTIIPKASNALYTAGCSDEEADTLIEMVFSVFDTLGLEAAKAVANHITNINPDYKFSTNPKTCKKQIADLR